jgi:threonine synthase
MGVYGVFRAAKQLLAMGKSPRLPGLLCVQQETCAPMVAAWREGAEKIEPHHVVQNPVGIAQAILRGNPTRSYPPVREIVLESGGTFTSVSEREIREARETVEDLEGIRPCFSASTALAGLIKQVRAKEFPVNESVLVNLTGSDRMPEGEESRCHYLKRCGGGWTPEDPSDEETRSHWDGDAG